MRPVPHESGAGSTPGHHFRIRRPSLYRLKRPEPSSDYKLLERLSPRTVHWSWRVATVISRIFETGTPVKLLRSVRHGAGVTRLAFNVIEQVHSLRNDGEGVWQSSHFSHPSLRHNLPSVCSRHAAITSMLQGSEMTNGIFPDSSVHAFCETAARTTWAPSASVPSPADWPSRSRTSPSPRAIAPQLAPHVQTLSKPCGQQGHAGVRSR
jgi:hypothetical protein